jgi:ABC-2 type transport system ATP-binding protein
LISLLHLRVESKSIYNVKIIDEGKMNAIDVKGLKKFFGSFQAMRGVNFSAAEGEILSLLGPNCAGKSTAISMLSGLLQPSEGEADILGHSVITEPDIAKSFLGVVPQDIALYPDLSARENLVFWGKMYGLKGGSAQAARNGGAGGHRPQ